VRDPRSHRKFREKEKKADVDLKNKLKTNRKPLISKEAGLTEIRKDFSRKVGKLIKETIPGYGDRD